MARNRERIEPAAFADEVLKLLKWSTDGMTGRPPPPIHSVDTCKAAFGLSVIKQLLDRESAPFLQQGLPGLIELAKMGMLEAYDIIDALTTGRDHPIFDLDEGIRARYREGSAPPTMRELHGRMVLVGLVRAHCTAYSTRTGKVASELEAFRVVAESCSFKDFKITPGRIKGWNRRFRDEQNDHPDIYAAQFLKGAAQLPQDEPLEERVVKAGQLWAWAYWVTPMPKPA